MVTLKGVLCSLKAYPVGPACIHVYKLEVATAAVKSLLTVMALLQQTPWSER